MDAMEFTIERTSADDSSVAVDGRNCGRVLAVGDIFTRASREAGGEVRPVNLRVSSIHAYGRLLEQLAPGMTARLTLVGDCDRALAKGDTLAG